MKEGMKVKINKFLSLLLVIMVLLTPVVSQAEEGQEDKDHYTAVDEGDGDVIFQTAVELVKGDYYITAQNKKYEVTAVDGNQAEAEFKESVDLLENEEEQFALTQGIVAEDGKKKVALYHTHSSESYVPTSGKQSEPGRGDIHDVSQQLAEELKGQGIEVDYSDSNHDPHDGGAYERSRRTAMKLVRQRPDAIFDIHRDGVPNPDEYVTEVDGERTARVSMVVGRQNPQREVNKRFAKHLKAVSDRDYPGLVKGILFAQGKYNQDLSPRSVILEFGTHTISKQLAVNSTDLVAESINKLLYGAQSDERQASENRGAYSSILVILLVALLGGGLLLVANAGGVSEALEKIKNITNRGE
jgi:stage II sporulation protein P